MKKHILIFYIVGGVLTLASVAFTPLIYIAQPFIVIAIIGTVKHKKQKQAPGSTSEPDPIPQTATPQIKKEFKTYKVAGVTHYLDNILSLAIENPDYELSQKELIDEGYENTRVYQYEFFSNKIELIPEPDNPHDPNAIKVVIDGVLVGYIKSGSCSRVHKLLRENRIKKIDAEIGGGKYKYIGYDEDDDKYYIEKDDIPFFVHLSILED